MEKKSPEQLAELITKIDKKLVKLSLREVLSVDKLCKEDADILYLKYGRKIIKVPGEKRYESREGHAIDGQTLDSSYCLHIGRID